MAQPTDIVLILGSGPNAPEAALWPKPWVDRIVVINNAWRVRPDWDDLIYPEDFPPHRRPARLARGQRGIEAAQFVPTQNAYGGFVYGGGTMAFTAGYWALHALRPRILAFMGCDLVYPRSGPTHFYGTGAADPLRPDPTLQDLGAKSARLGLLAARDGCLCVNLSRGPSRLLFQRADARHLRRLASLPPPTPPEIEETLAREDRLGFFVPSGRYWEQAEDLDPQALAALDGEWRSLWHGTATGSAASASCRAA